MRKRIAAYINAPWEDVVLVDNASNALMVLLQKWVFKENEGLLVFATAYVNFKNYYNWLHATSGVEIVTVPFTFPLAGPPTTKIAPLPWLDFFATQCFFGAQFHAGR